MKGFWIFCLIIMILLLVVLAGYLLIGLISYKMVFSRNGKIKNKVEKSYNSIAKSLGEDRDYFDSDFEEIKIKREENVVLSGFIKTKLNKKLAILVHGYGADHYQMSPYAKMFEKNGYDILAIDVRCHGKSGGKNLTMGKIESEDLLAWINKALEINPEYKVLLFGLSMGATTVCMSVGKEIPQNVTLAIEDCGYDNLNKQLSHVYFKSKYRLKIFYKIFYNFTKKTMGLDLKKVDALNAVKHTKLPMLFIHGNKDNFVPTNMLNSLSSQVPSSRRHIYIAEDAGHIESYSKNQSRYEKEVKKFLTLYNM